jgi:uncharacterized protein YutE (UPF0331/DUF86 family)
MRTDIMMEANEIERLVFVKYLLFQSNSQVLLERPLSSVAVLTLHDLVECFLQLAYEHNHKKGKPNGSNILDVYSEELNKLLVERDLPTINKAYIKRLNELRNQLKHSTIFVDKKAIERLQSETETFIKDFTAVFFKVSFEGVSLVLLVSNDEVRRHLATAEAMIKIGDIHLAALEIGKAFYEYEEAATGTRNKRGFKMIHSQPGRVNYLIRHEATMGAKPMDTNLKRGLEDVASDINELKQEVFSLQRAQLLHLDVRKLIVFHDIIPSVSKIQSTNNGQTVVNFFIPSEEVLKKEDFSKAEVKFCFDFVLDTVLSFQEKAYS